MSGGSFADSPSYSRAMWGGHALEQLQGTAWTGAATVLLLPSPTSFQHPPRRRGPLPACARLLLGGQGWTALHLTARAWAPFSGSPECCPPPAPPREEDQGELQSVPDAGNSLLTTGNAAAPDTTRPRDSAGRSCLCDGAQPQQDLSGAGTPWGAR